MPGSEHRYDLIGATYSRFRRPDPLIAAVVADAIGRVDRVVDVGSGTGSYSPAENASWVVAVEPSLTMIRQRPPSAPAVLRALSDDLPFAGGAFDVAQAVLTTHHWADVPRGLAEMSRVAERLVILTWDPAVFRRFWLVEDYLPEIGDAHSGLGALDQILPLLPGADVRVVPVPWDCHDGFGAAYWRRPEMYLDPLARLAISAFSFCDPDAVDVAIRRLEADLGSGRWEARHRDLLNLAEFDAGYRVVVR